MKPSRCSLTISLMFVSLISVFAQEPELRGVWMTPRSDGGFWSKAQIAQAMDSVTENNFNVVYFNAWSRGWPLWRSDVFFRETGYWTDPAAGERDILQEAITEAHRRGLEIEAWMEYGFAGWWSGSNLPGYPKGPLFATQPDWLARDSGGSDEFPIPQGVFYWMNHNHPGARQFLIELHKEIAEKYDIDGIELDRIRYPNLNCGYDSLSIATFRSEMGNPTVWPAASDPQWMRWRADRLNLFHQAVYDSIKSANRFVIVSNAPSHYGSGLSYSAYQSFLQDWRQWLNAGKLDAAHVQMYVQPTLLQSYIPSALEGLPPEVASRVYAGIAVKPGGVTMTPTEMIQLIGTARISGLKGQSIWYHNDLISTGYFGLIKSQVYRSRVPLPYHSQGWRSGGLIQDEGGAAKGEGWTQSPPNVTTAWMGRFLYADSSGPRWIEYAFDIPVSAYYEVYVYISQLLLPQMTTRATYEVLYGAGAMAQVVVDQSDIALAGWHKLGDFHLEGGGSRAVVRLSNTGIGAGKWVTADAAMLILNRRLSPSAIVSVEEHESERHAPEAGFIQNYPNPFNSATTILYHVPRQGRVRIDVFDTLGRSVATPVDSEQEEGIHIVPFDGSSLSSGLYVLRLQAGWALASRKMMLTK